MEDNSIKKGESLVDLRQGLSQACKADIIAAAVFSGVANLLMLVPAFFMLNVYDKALASNSLSTLAVLSIITAAMFLGLAAMETMRSKILVAIGKKIDKLLGSLVYEATFKEAFRVGSTHATAGPIQDFNNLRQFASGTGAITAFDAPWIPVYIVVMFLFHPVLGWLGVVSALLLLCVAIANQRSTTAGLKRANATAHKNMTETNVQLKNAEVAESMGMLAPMQERWRHQQDNVIGMQAETSNTAGMFNAVTKTLRLAIQSTAIGLGALLVLQQEISPGMLIAGSILVGRALQPIEVAVGAWRGFVEAKGQYDRLTALLENHGSSTVKMTLPQIQGLVTASNVTIALPGKNTPAISDSTFSIAAGTVCLIVGPSGAGKSSLIKGILGLWPTASGAIRIDGADAAYYERGEIGPQIGYLPQDIELFDGSVSDNIARLGEVDATDVIAAAEDAGIHQFILSLPNGYDTKLGLDSGVMLSPGQRQRIALARALYRRPQLVVLDEPNSNLDSAGEQALNRAVEILRKSGSTVIIVSHREHIRTLADQLLVVSAGKIVDSGTTEEVMARFAQKIQSPSNMTPPKKVPQTPKSIKTFPV